MSLRWLLVLAAEAVTIGLGANRIGAHRACAADASALPAVAAPPVVSRAEVLPGAAVSGSVNVEPVARSPKELREAVAQSIHRANEAKGGDRAAAVRSLIEVYRQLGRDVRLPVKERLRLAAQVRTRLQRFAGQFHYEIAHIHPRGGAPLAGNSNASGSGVGAAGGPAVEGLDSLIEVIQTTIGQPADWVAAEQNGAQPAGNAPTLGGGVGAGFGGAGAAHGGGAFGGNDAFEKAADSNGADLVDLIQKTIDPPSWDVNGGPGSIMYFNNLRVLVVRQTGEGQDDVGGVLGGLRK